MSYCKDTRIELLKSRGMPIIETLEDFSNELLISEVILKRIYLHSYTYYKEFYIQKNSSSKELRKIAAPKYTLKAIQAWILRNILERVELSPYAMAYRKGNEFGIKCNADMHKDKEFIMKVDFKNFFSSISRKIVFYMFNDFGYSNTISNLFANICTYNESLPQGAVTSPYISNIVLIKFDEDMYEYCLNQDITYSRYSDDIILSCNRRRPLNDSKEFINELTKKYNYLEINHDKSFNIYGRNTAKIVTGLLVNNGDVRVTREYKRLLRAQLYTELKVNNMDPSEEIYGKLAFIRSVDQSTFIQMVNYIKNIGIDNKFKSEFLAVPKL